jgi:hypothetical protein
MDWMQNKTRSTAMFNELVWRKSETAIRGYSGELWVAALSPVTSGPARGSWRWGVKYGLTAGLSESLEAAQSQADTAWRSWLSKAGLNGQGIPSLRVELARDTGVPVVNPEDDYAVHSGQVLVGTLTEDPHRHMDARIIRPPGTRPWSYLLQRDYEAPPGNGWWGGAENKEEALSALRAGWLRWLYYAEVIT